MAVRRLGFYARCGAVDVGWTEHLFDAWFRVLVLPCGRTTPDAETTVQGLADCYRRTMGDPQWKNTSHSTARMGPKPSSDHSLHSNCAACPCIVRGRAAFSEKWLDNVVKYGKLGLGHEV